MVWFSVVLCEQHLQDILELDMSALDWMMKAYPDVKEREDMRRIIGRYGLSGTQQVTHTTPAALHECHTRVIFHQVTVQRC